MNHKRKCNCQSQPKHGIFKKNKGEERSLKFMISYNMCINSKVLPYFNKTSKRLRYIRHLATHVVQREYSRCSCTKQNVTFIFTGSIGICASYTVAAQFGWPDLRANFSWISSLPRFNTTIATVTFKGGI